MHPLNRKLERLVNTSDDMYSHKPSVEVLRFVTDELNNQFYSSIDEDDEFYHTGPFAVNTYSGMYGVTFIDVELWSTEFEGSRIAYEEELNFYEPMDKFLIRESKSYIQRFLKYIRKVEKKM